MTSHPLDPPLEWYDGKSWLVTPLARQPISCYYVRATQVISMSFCAPPRAKSWRRHCTKKLRSVIIPTWHSQWPIRTVKSDCSLISSMFHSPVTVSPDPLNARSFLSLGFPKSPHPPPSKNPRSANALNRFSSVINCCHRFQLPRWLAYYARRTSLRLT